MNRYIHRDISKYIKEVEKFYRVIVLTGPRQSGKSTLCRHLFEDYAYFNLEDISLRDRIKNDPKAFLATCGEKVIIDEVQRYPDLMSYIQVIVDDDPYRRFLLTGSNNFSLMQNITRSLAGRAALFTLLPLSMKELGKEVWNIPTNQLIFNGFYPAIYSSEITPSIFYANYTSTYVERDVCQLIELKNQERFMSFIRLCALRIGSELNKADLAKSVGVSATTISDWISILKASYIIFTLPPYSANLSKRLTKTPKLYFYDTGLASYLMGATNPDQIELPVVKGAIFENLVIPELMKRRMNVGQEPHLMFYRENSGKEVDIVDDKGLSMNLYEVKASSTFKQEFMANMNYLKELFPLKDVTCTLIYDGESTPPSILNVRDI